MKSISGVIVVIVAVIMIFAQFGGNRSANLLYDSKPQVPEQISPPQGWPPTLDAPYPDMTLIDQDGIIFKLSDFKGKVLVILPINMSNKTSVALENAALYGAFKGIVPEAEVKPLSVEIRRSNSALRNRHEDLVYIHLIFHDLSMQIPNQDDAILWANHFKLSKDENHIVAIPADRIPDFASNDLVPGVQLVDKKFLLRGDATGHAPKTHLNEILVPMISIALESD